MQIFPSTSTEVYCWIRLVTITNLETCSRLLMVGKNSFCADIFRFNNSSHEIAMSWNKMNVFHWHLLDSTAFPYVSKKFPELAEKGSYSPVHQYDEKFIKEFVEYAKERGIRVMPEIEAPGHSTSWAYG